MSKELLVAKEGFDAQYSSDIRDFSFSSKYNTLKYDTSGFVTLAVSGANAETSVTHGLGYIPFFDAYVNYFSAASSTRFNHVPGTFLGPGIYAYAMAYADNNKIYFRVETNTATVTYTFYYKIFRNDTNL